VLETEAGDIGEREVPACTDVLECADAHLEGSPIRCYGRQRHGRAAGVQEPGLVAGDEMTQLARHELVVGRRAGIGGVDRLSHPA
jgi:hypothetical protein